MSKALQMKSKTALAEEVEAKLNQQVKMEGISSFYYLTMASWCEKNGYLKSAEFLYHHSEEEKLHMMKLIRYINEVGGYALAPEIKNLKYEYDSLRDVYEHVLEHEVAVTNAINGLFDYCFQKKDFITMQFMQWYVNEQREEESLARRILEIFDIIGEAGQGLWLIDQEIGNIHQALLAQAAQQAGA